MTKALENAIRIARELPDADQDALAALIIAEIDDEAAWAASFADSQDALERLGREAMAEYRAGKTLPLDL